MTDQAETRRTDGERVDRSRRSFLRRAGQTMLVSAGMLAGVGSLAQRAEAATANRVAACCSLIYNPNCPGLKGSGCSCFGRPSGPTTWWVWSCTFNGEAYGCLECYCDRCSLAYLQHCC